MLKIIARTLIKRMENRYDSDMAYAVFLLDKSPEAFAKFMRAGGMLRHRERAPIEAAFTVQLLATLYEDCGSCLQLIVQMAEESGMSTDQIEAVLAGNRDAMHPSVTLAYRYADALLNRRANLAEAREAVRAQWGDKGLIDLALNLQGARLFPMMKQALGFAQLCHRVKTSDRSVDIVKEIA